MINLNRASIDDFQKIFGRIPNNITELNKFNSECKNIIDKMINWEDVYEQTKKRIINK